MNISKQMKLRGLVGEIAPVLTAPSNNSLQRKDHSISFSTTPGLFSHAQIIWGQKIYCKLMGHSGKSVCCSRDVILRRTRRSADGGQKKYPQRAKQFPNSFWNIIWLKIIYELFISLWIGLCLAVCCNNNRQLSKMLNRSACLKPWNSSVEP